MTIDERTIRHEIGRQAQTAVIPSGLADRILDECLPGHPSAQPALPGPSMLRRWLAPSLAATCVLLLIAAAMVGRTLLRSSQPAGRPGPSGTQGAPIAPAPSLSGSPRGSAVPTAPSSSPAASLPPTSPAQQPPGGALPAGFTVRDLSFVSLSSGWALGAYACGDVAIACPTAVARTTDAGRTWVPLAAPPWNGSQVTDIEHIRFADERVGYAFSPTALYLTVDGGTTWIGQPDGAWGLEVANGMAVRVLGQGTCAPGCDYRVERAPVGSSSWQPVRLPGGAFPDGAQLVRTGHVLALATYGHISGGGPNARGALFVSTDDGASWVARTVCPDQPGGGEVDLQATAMAPDGTLLVACTARMAGHGVFLQLSTDNGVSFRTLPATLGSAPISTIGAASSGVLFVQSDLLWRSADNGLSWQRAAGGSQQGPLSASFIGFENSSTGRVVEASPTGSSNVGTGTIWTTTDAGRTWSSFSFR